MSKESYLSDLRNAIDSLKREGRNRTVVVHHNDADGLSSAAVLKTALEGNGYSTEILPLERINPSVVERIFDIYEDPVIFCDLGGRAAPEIARINAGRNLILIIDHHMPSEVREPRVLNLATEFYGLSGERDISAAAAAYLFARVLDEENLRLAYLGVVGAIGDSHDRFGCLTGVNREVLKEAVELGQIKILKKDGREEYMLVKLGDIPISKLAKDLTVLGAVDYYSDGPTVGINLCFEGYTEKSRRKLKGLYESKRLAFERMTKELIQGELKQTKYVQWFHVHDKFVPMGVKIVGEFCMEIRDQKFMDPNKYIAGFQNMPSEVPKLGKFDWSRTKVSMRVPSSLEKKIIDGEMPGLAYLLPEAAKLVGGMIDACHNYAGATDVPLGREEALIGKINEVLDNSN